MWALSASGVLESFRFWDEDDYESISTQSSSAHVEERDQPVSTGVENGLRVRDFLRFSQHWVSLTREPAWFWRENVIAVVILIYYEF